MLIRVTLILILAGLAGCSTRRPVPLSNAPIPATLVCRYTAQVISLVPTLEMSDFWRLHSMADQQEDSIGMKVRILGSDVTENDPACDRRLTGGMEAEIAVLSHYVDSSGQSNEYYIRTIGAGDEIRLHYRHFEGHIPGGEIEQWVVEDESWRLL